MAKKSSLFIRQSVIGLGFLSGLFTAIGFDPQGAIIRAIGDAVNSAYPDPQIRALFLLLPTILLLVSVITAYLNGGIMGLLSVIVAYFAGMALLSSLMLAIALLLAAVVLGYLATSRRLLRRIRP